MSQLINFFYNGFQYSNFTVAEAQARGVPADVIAAALSGLPPIPEPEPNGGLSAAAVAGLASRDEIAPLEEKILMQGYAISEILKAINSATDLAELKNGLSKMAEFTAIETEIAKSAPFYPLEPLEENEAAGKKYKKINNKGE
jgi:hypothetical protein